MTEVQNFGCADVFQLMDAPWAGERLKDVRMQADLNQYDVAALVTKVRAGIRSSVGQAMISQWESGKRTPDAADIFDICVALHCTSNDLYKPVGTKVRWQGGKPEKPADDE